MAEHRPAAFYATCEVTPRARSRATRLAVSKALSLPRLHRRVVRPGSDHFLNCLTFRPARRVRSADIDDQAMATFNEQMPHISKPRRLAFGFAIQPGIRIGGRGVGVLLPVSLWTLRSALRLSPAGGSSASSLASQFTLLLCVRTLYLIKPNCIPAFRTLLLT